MDIDPVLIVVRKDLRRSRYRVNIIVNGFVEYFDTLWKRRYRGITIYVKPDEEGQSETYVVLEEAKIGVRIRESKSRRFKNERRFFESFGLLDITVSVPMEYLPTVSLEFHFEKYKKRFRKFQ